MRNPHAPSFLIPALSRWVRFALKAEAKRAGVSVGEIVEICVARVLDPDVVAVAKGRAQAAIAGRALRGRTRGDLLAELRTRPIEVAREAKRAKAWAAPATPPADPGTGWRTGRAPIRLAPDLE